MRDSLIAFVRAVIARDPSDARKPLFHLALGDRRIAFGHGYFAPDRVLCSALSPGGDGRTAPDAGEERDVEPAVAWLLGDLGE